MVLEETMRKLGALALAAALAIGPSLAAVWAASDEEDPAEVKPAAKQNAIRWSPLFARMFDLDPNRAPPKKPASPAKKPSPKKAAQASKSANKVDQAAASRTHDEATLLRRLQ